MSTPHPPFDHRLYEHRQAQTYERTTLEAKDSLRSSKELAQEFMTKTKGNTTAATRFALHHARALFPGFIPRKSKGTPAERLYNRLQKAIATQAKTWSL